MNATSDVEDSDYDKVHSRLADPSDRDELPSRSPFNSEDDAEGEPDEDDGDATTRPSDSRAASPGSSVTGGITQRMQDLGKTSNPSD